MNDLILKLFFFFNININKRNKMATKFILIFKKGKKRPIGAIPIKKGVSLQSIKKTIPKQLKNGFKARIISKETLKKVVLRLRPKTRTKFRRKSLLIRKKR